MKIGQQVSQIGADLAIQLMLSTMIRLVADLTNDPDRILTEMRTMLLDLTASHALPELPAGEEKAVRDAARTVITFVLANAGAPQTH